MLRKKYASSYVEYREESEIKRSVMKNRKGTSRMNESTANMGHVMEGGEALNIVTADTKLGGSHVEECQQKSKKNRASREKNSFKHRSSDDDSFWRRGFDGFDAYEIDSSASSIVQKTSVPRDHRNQGEGHEEKKYKRSFDVMNSLGATQSLAPKRSEVPLEKGKRVECPGSAVPEGQNLPKLLYIPCYDTVGESH